MKKVLVLLSVLAALAVSAGDTSNISVEAGYNNQYIVNGVSRSEGAAFVGVGAVKSLKYADVYLGGTLLANGDLDQSHWTLGAGKEVNVWKDVFSARLDTTVTRHQAGNFGIPNSTEFGVKLALPNKFVTPYLRGFYDVDLKQSGVFIGAERAQNYPRRPIKPSRDDCLAMSTKTKMQNGCLTRVATSAPGLKRDRS